MRGLETRGAMRGSDPRGPPAVGMALALLGLRGFGAVMHGLRLRGDADQAVWTDQDRSPSQAGLFIASPRVTDQASWTDRERPPQADLIIAPRHEPSVISNANVPLRASDK